MEVNFIAEGFKFMILGMTTVFFFLTLMVYVLEIQYIFIKKFFPQAQTPAPQQASKKEDKLNDDVVVAIVSAVQHFRISQKGR